jgi:ferredoxin
VVKISVDMDKCQNYGQCCFEAEDVFQLDADGNLEYSKEVDESRRDDVVSAADVCPMQAITVE